MLEEYIIDIAAVSDDKVVCKPWESVVKLSYVQGVWKALLTKENNYSNMRRDIARRVEEWTLGDKSSVKVMFELVDGRKMSYNEYVAEIRSKLWLRTLPSNPEQYSVF